MRWWQIVFIKWCQVHSILLPLWIVFIVAGTKLKPLATLSCSISKRCSNACNKWSKKGIMTALFKYSQGSSAGILILLICRPHLRGSDGPSAPTVAAFDSTIWNHFKWNWSTLLRTCCTLFFVPAASSYALQISMELDCKPTLRAFTSVRVFHATTIAIKELNFVMAARSVDALVDVSLFQSWEERISSNKSTTTSNSCTKFSNASCRWIHLVLHKSIRCFFLLGCSVWLLFSSNAACRFVEFSNKVILVTTPIALCTCWT